MALLLSAAFPPSLAGQEEVVPFIEGRAQAGGEPLAGTVVVLHQVGPEFSGEIDSIRTAADGSFRIRLPHVPSHSVDAEIFFASVRYRGLHYFGPAITTAVQLDSLYRIQAYDTLSVPPGGASLPLLSRRVFLEKASQGWTATDVFQLSNEGDRTLYSPEDGTTWKYPLPPGARDFEVGQADLAPELIRFRDGQMDLSNPLPPGDLFLMVRYGIPDEEFVLPVPGRTDLIEILLREPGPSAEFPPLMLDTPVELEAGNVYRRYAGEDLVDTQIRAAVAPEPFSFEAEWMGLVLAGLLMVAGVFGLRRRRARQTPAPPPTPRDREELVLEIARLDEEFERSGNPSPSARASYEAQRRVLLQKLKQRSEHPG